MECLEADRVGRVPKGLELCEASWLVVRHEVMKAIIGNEALVP